MADLKFFQIALNTIDLAATVRFYNEVFGYANAGGQVGWGDVMKVQGLDPDGQTLVWWMIGRHPRIQFEIFHHTGPLLRKQQPDWTPADHGWVRYGVAVGDYDAVAEKLVQRGIEPMGEHIDRPGTRRMAIRDPYCGIAIEIWEDGKHVPGVGLRETNPFDPLILYATSSVSDIAAARRYYGEILGLKLAPIEILHAEEDERLWGLAGASREGFLVKTTNGYIEVVEYHSPMGRPRPEDHRLSDQGIMNVALYSNETSAVQEVIDRLDAEGNPPPWLTVGEGVLGIYINEPDREVELLACPPEVEAQLGFTWQGEFNGGDFIRMVERDVAGKGHSH